MLRISKNVQIKFAHPSTHINIQQTNKLLKHSVKIKYPTKTNFQPMTIFSTPNRTCFNLQQAIVETTLNIVFSLARWLLRQNNEYNR